MKVLFAAISNKFLADGKYGLTALYNTEADDEAVFPYATMTLIDNVPDWTFTDKSEECFVQFNLFDATVGERFKSSDEISTSAEDLIAAFDFFDLDVAGYTTVSLTRVSANLRRIEGVWQYRILYRILIEKN